MRLKVYGDPVPQGSKRIVMSKRDGRALLIDVRPKDLREYRRAIAAAATEWAKRHGWTPLDTGVIVRVSFYLSRPKSARKRAYPHVKPDLDKLCRAVFDGLAGIAYTEDSRVVQLDALKMYAEGDDPPMTAIAVTSVTTTR